MLFQLHPNTPKFEVFRLLNEEFIHFLAQSIPIGDFRRELFTQGQIGQACWDNCKENLAQARNKLTRDKFSDLFIELQNLQQVERQQLYDIVSMHQDINAFFAEPTPRLLDFLPRPCNNALGNIATHLYCSTKGLQNVINAARGVTIIEYYNTFSNDNFNGNVCKACGMQKLSPIRANIPDEEQWRADLDHQLCKSKYPIYAVHPDNLIPLCDICNQDAKKAKDLFVASNGDLRRAFNPFTECANEFINIDIIDPNDPEPKVKVVWDSQDPIILEKLATWNDVYEIKNLVEGNFRNLEEIIIDKIRPDSYEDCREQIRRKARPVFAATLLREEWAFWHQKLFHKLNQINLTAIWAKCEFKLQQGKEGADFILER